MIAGLDHIYLSNFLPNTIDSDGNTDLFTAGSFAGDLLDPTIGDAGLFQDAFWLAQPSLPPTYEYFPLSSGDVLPFVQAVERKSSLPLSTAPGVSVIPQAATLPAHNAARVCHRCYERATGADLVLTGDIHIPVAAPTLPLLSPPSTSAAAFPANWIRVPQRNYNHGCKQYDFKLLEPIPFSTKDHPGINLGDALRKNCTRLSGKNDQILQATSAVSSCRLLFPGYPDNGSSCQIHMLNWAKTRTPISRKELAHEVAKKVDRYLTHMARINPDRSVEDFWRVNQGFMHIDNMYLVSLISVSKGSFQPEIYVKVPSEIEIEQNIVSVPPHVDAGGK